MARDQTFYPQVSEEDHLGGTGSSSSGGEGAFDVGMSLVYFGSTAPLGWLFLNGDTIGDATSGATHADSDYEDLFTHLWGSIGNTELPIQTSGGIASTRGVSAAADFAAHKRLPLPDYRGRSPIGAGTGTGLTARTIGAQVGEENHLLTVSEMPAHRHLLVAAASVLSTALSNSNQIARVRDAGNDFSVGLDQAGTSTDATLGRSESVGGGTSHNVVHPSLACYFIVKWAPNQTVIGATGATGATGSGITNLTLDTFSGNASTTAFTLSVTPAHENNTWVSIDGVLQHKSTYSVSGTTLTFSTAPPTGTSNIEVVTATGLDIGTPSDSTVTRAKLVQGAVAPYNIAIKLANYTALTTDDVILCGSTWTLTLFAASNTGRALKVKNRGTGIITIARAGADIFDDGSTSIALQPLDAVELIPDGLTTWSVF
jgi:microcystin-dependent protein